MNVAPFFIAGALRVNGSPRLFDDVLCDGQTRSETAMPIEL